MTDPTAGNPKPCPCHLLIPCPGPPDAGDVEALTRVLAEHEHVGGGCRCGWVRHRADYPTHREHVATAIAALLSDDLAKAWVRGEWAGRQNAAEVLRVAHWSHIGLASPNLIGNPFGDTNGDCDD